MDKAENLVSMKQPKENPAKVWQPNQDASDFLLAEFERLQSVRSEINNHSSRRFEFYLTFTSAAIGALVLISQGQNFMLSRSILDLIAIGFFTYGMITFLNLSWASSAYRELIVALHNIQDFFIGTQPNILDYLYFRHDHEPENRYKFLRILGRGIGGGSEKAVVTLVNSSLLTYLVSSLLVSYLRIQLSPIAFQGILVLVFLLSCITHAIIVSITYKFCRL